jgi:toxin ParE1/3/4
MPGGRKPVNLHAEARAELKDSVTFYRTRGGDVLAARFKQEVAQVFETIRNDPERFPPGTDVPGVQKCRLIHFPFSILYLNEPRRIWIVAIVHSKRRPGYWQHRVD